MLVRNVELCIDCALELKFLTSYVVSLLVFLLGLRISIIMFENHRLVRFVRKLFWRLVAFQKSPKRVSNAIASSETKFEMSKKPELPLRGQIFRGCSCDFSLAASAIEQG